MARWIAIPGLLGLGAWLGVLAYGVARHAGPAVAPPRSPGHAPSARAASVQPPTRLACTAPEEALLPRPAPPIVPDHGSPLQRVTAVLRGVREDEYYEGRLACLAAVGFDGVVALSRIARADEQRDPALAPLASLAIHALADARGPRALDVLRRLWTEATGPAPAPVERSDAIARALFDCGLPGPLESAVAELEGLEQRFRDTPAQAEYVAILTRLAGRYGDADRWDAAATAYTTLAGLDRFHADMHRFCAMCACAEAGEPEQALAVMREASCRWTWRGPFRDVLRLRRNGHLRSLLGRPAFDYLCAGVLARAHTYPGCTRFSSEAVPVALAWLTGCANAGYRVADPADRRRLFFGLRGVPQFERLWTTLVAGR